MVVDKLSRFAVVEWRPDFDAAATDGAEKSATRHLALRTSLVCIGEWKRVYRDAGSVAHAARADG
jgi:hypothetical protein